MIYYRVCNEEKNRFQKACDDRKGSRECGSYIDWNGTTHYCNSYTLFDTLQEQTGWTLGTGWYVVNRDRTCSSHRMTVNGDVNLILCDNVTLTIGQGIRMYNGSLTIWCQSLDKSGKLICTARDSTCAGIGGNKGENGGTLILQGGEVIASGGKYASGVGGGDAGAGGSVTVYGGNLKATGGDYGSGIGGGEDRDGGSLTVYGGTVTANGGKQAAGIGGGNAGSQGGDVIIYGGTVMATGLSGGAGVGGGEYVRGGGQGGNVTIFDGSLTAIGGGDKATGIGPGKDYTRAERLRSRVEACIPKAAKRGPVLAAAAGISLSPEVN